MGNISQNKDLDSVSEKYLLTNRIVRKQINFQGCTEIPVTEDIPADENTRAVPELLEWGGRQGTVALTLPSTI